MSAIPDATTKPRKKKPNLQRNVVYREEEEVDFVIFQKPLTRDLRDDYFTDVIFFVILLLFGTFVDAGVPIVSCVTHILTSSVAGLVLSYSKYVSPDLKRPRKFAQRIVIVTALCAGLTMAFDFLFITQTLCSYITHSETEPVGFSVAVPSSGHVSISILLSSHVISFVASFFRIFRSGTQFGVQSSVACIGVTLAVVVSYSLWLIDLGKSTGALSLHLWLWTLAVCYQTVDIIHVFTDVVFLKVNFWWINAIALALQYAVLVANITALNEEVDTFAKQAFTHHYDHLWGKWQGIALSLALTISNAHRCIQLLPKYRLSECQWKSPKMLMEIDFYAAFVSFLLKTSGVILPTLGTLVILFQRDNHSISRWVMLLYFVQLTFRFFVLTNALQPMLFLVVSCIGFALDAVLIVFLVLEKRPTVLLVISTISAGTCLCCVFFSAYQWRSNVIKKKCR